jgi:hypothetical protein
MKKVNKEWILLHFYQQPLGFLTLQKQGKNSFTKKTFKSLQSIE